MFNGYKRVGLVVVVETLDGAQRVECDSLRVVSTHHHTELVTACIRAAKLSKDCTARTVSVLTWSLDRGTNLECTFDHGEAVHYMPSLLRDAPCRWNAVLLHVIEQHLSTVVRLEIPVEAPAGYVADVDPEADTEDAIESPFVGEVK